LSLEIKNGHRIREPSDKNTNYRSQIKKIYVNGFHEGNENVAESRGIEKDRRVIKRISGEIGGTHWLNKRGY
jgi:hypothetical protein